MPTRGERHLRSYIGKGVPVVVDRRKRAREVVPVLQAKCSAGVIPESPEVGTGFGITQGERGAGKEAATKKGREEGLSRSTGLDVCRTPLGHRQQCLLEALARTTAEDPSPRSTVFVKRAKLESMQQVVDVLGEASLRRAALPAATAVLALVEDDATAVEVQQKLRQWGAAVARVEALLLSTQEGCDGLTRAVRSALSAAPSPPKAKKAKKARREEGGGGEGAVRGVVLLGTPRALLEADASAELWGLLGGVAVLLAHPASSARSLVRQLQPATGEPAEAALDVARLAEVRWGALGHIRTTCVVSLRGDRLALAAELHPLLAPPATPPGGAGGGGEAPPPPPTADPTEVHYRVATGVDRFGFLISLVKALRPQQGLVVHFATKEGCGFMYDVFYHFMHHQKDLPAHVELLTDYEGEGAYTSVASAAQQDLLCRRFDQIVRDRAEAPAGSTASAPTTTTSTTAAVLFSCYGLVPTAGTIFLSYDIVPDVPNFGHFVRKALAPPGRRATTDAFQGGARSEGAKSDSGEVGHSEKRGEVTLKEVPAYRHIFLLLRPNEVKGMLRHVRLTGAALNLTYTLLAHGPSQASYHLAAEKLKSLNKKLFPIQNLAFLAYKATMKAYSGVGPRDVYDEKQLNLEKAAEEFGFTEVPLLDLRLRDNSFRPKEDLYKVSRKKQAEERRAYKRFAESNIPIAP